MFTKAQQDAIDRLEKYLQEATKEQLEDDLKKIAVWQHTGPTWEEYVKALSKTLSQPYYPEDRKES